MTKTRMTAVPAAALAMALTLTACAGEPDDGTSTPEDTPTAQSGASPETDDVTAHNDADTRFAQMMIVHHEDAIEMAELAVRNATTEEVRALGERIAEAQGPEIELMSGWLDAWGEAQPDEADMTGMGHEGMDMEGMDMEGMDQEAVMAELTGLDGAGLDRRFLELMIEHHKGAIVMAETERGEGQNSDATGLSQKIIDDQTAEITEMTNLLNSL
jgi:uncharacterized protein (DUF305 family)